VYEILCGCDEGCGLPHRHIPKCYEVLFESGYTGVIRQPEYDMNRKQISAVLSEIPETISVPIPWKEVARTVMAGE
jgi:hypothetical protein